jgi:hypothetical protein
MAHDAVSLLQIGKPLRRLPGAALLDHNRLQTAIRHDADERKYRQ